MSSFQAFNATLDDDPNVKGRQFEVVCKWLLENAPSYANKLKKVWHWDEWPGRWGADAGIDLVAETTTGELWAIQSKAYSEDTAIKKSEIDSFLSESSRSVFSYRLLISTTDLLGKTAERTLNDQEKPVGRILRSDLNTTLIDWPESFNAMLPVRQEAKELLPHQEEAVKNIVSGFKTNKRGQLISACGTGKTFTGLSAAKVLGAQRILVLVPSISLLKDTIQEWNISFGDFDFIPVCSDVTVSSSDEAIENVSQLGFPVTTDANEISTFLLKDSTRPLVVFSTYQSSPKTAAAFTLGDTPEFDLVICDEAHRTVGAASSDFATILDNDLIPASRRLFMTATPCYFTEKLKKAAKESDYGVCSMDDETVYGKVFNKLIFSEAIERELLSDYQVVVVAVDSAECLELVESGRHVTVDGKEITDARTLAIQIGLLKAIKEYNLQRVISFHSRISSASKFAHSISKVNEWLPEDQRPSGKLWATHVSGAMPAGERSKRLDSLRQVGVDERGLLSNVRCLSEGIDVPALDGVAFIDPRHSEVDIIQAVGRVIRSSKDKKIGTIVIPVFLDNIEDPEETLDSSVFSSVWGVVRALRAHDDVLCEELDFLRREQGRLGGSGTWSPKGLSKIQIILPESVGVEFSKSFNVSLVVHATRNLEMHLGLLDSYFKREGHTKVPKGHMENGINLYNVIAGMRQSYAKGAMSQELIKRLEAYPEWEWRPTSSKLEKNLSALDSYFKREGHIKVPRDYMENGINLYNIITRMRQSYAKGRLSQELIKRLEAYPEWEWYPLSSNLEKNLSALDSYLKREGHIKVPKGHMENGINLYTVIDNMRQSYAKGRLSQELVKRLEAYPGWEWRPTSSKLEKNLSALDSYFKREGHIKVTKGHVENGINLYTVIGKMRQSYAKGRLSQETIKRLEAYPGWEWSPASSNLEKNLSALDSYFKREGHIKVPRDYMENGINLYNVIDNMRRSCTKGLMSQETVVRLNRLGVTNKGGLPFEVIQSK